MEEATAAENYPARLQLLISTVYKTPKHIQSTDCATQRIYVQSKLDSTKHYITTSQQNIKHIVRSAAAT